MKYLSILLLFLLTAFLACKKPFNPETITAFNSALIVEGIINPVGSTNIYLSRTLDLDDKVTVKPELKATVQILSENNSAVTLTEKGAGLYTIPQLTLISAQKYRLKIKTNTGVEYISDAMAVRNTPAIDSVYWKKEAGGVGIYVDAHDSQNNTKYYQWDFEEDWEIRSIDSAKYKGVPNGQASPAGTRIITRDRQEMNLMYTCYKNQRSTNIDIFSTAKLSSDVVSQHPVVFIPNNSDKLSVKYSIIVRQYSLPFEAFEYLSMMKRNSEQLGSFFDAQPTELIGNIRNLNDSKDVAIGYVFIAPIIDKRIFITANQVPGFFRLNCEGVSIKNHPDSLGALVEGAKYIPQAPVMDERGAISRWAGLSQTCLDCRARGGNNVKPSFW